MHVICRTLAPCVLFALLGRSALGQAPDHTLPAFPEPTPPPAIAAPAVTAPAASEMPVLDNPLKALIAAPSVGCSCGHCGTKDCKCGDKCRCWKVPCRLTLRADWGDGVGYENGYTYGEAFVPVWQPNKDSVLFTDFRIVNFYDDDRWEFNAGLGGRAYAACLDGVVGWNAFYDTRANEGRSFGQVGVGVEYLRPWFEFRANGYFITGDDRGPGFIGATPIFQVAMDGVDAEIGAPVPFLDQFSTRAYIGYYHYEADGVQSTDGIRGRVEAQLGRSSSLHFVAQHDPLFDTTITGGLAFSFGAPAYSSRPGPATIREILGQRVVRDIGIVLTNILRN